MMYFVGKSEDIIRGQKGCKLFSLRGYENILGHRTMIINVLVVTDPGKKENIISKGLGSELLLAALPVCI